MALPSSGPLSLNDIQTEFGGANPISLSEYYRGGAYTTSNNTGVPTSGAISIGNFYGATRQFSFTISSNQTNANLRTLAVNAGWDQSAPVVATISAGVYISSNSTSTPALTISGSFPSGITLINNGFIVGMGGTGGSGSGVDVNTIVGGSAGSAGGLALSVSSAVSINNAGTIGGGGGGGGGGEGGQYTIVFGKTTTAYNVGGGGGGGGRSSAAANSSGGSGGPATFYTPSPGSSGGAGTSSGAGGGGAGGTGGGVGAGNGGAGGGWGSAGSSGNAWSAGSVGSTMPAGGPYGGGAGGGAVSGNSNITWIAFGTRLGSIT